MNFEFATKEQLLQISLYETCEIDLKYAAVRGLQYKKDIQADMLYRLIKEHSKACGRKVTV
jgi:hypothetical protein